MNHMALFWLLLWSAVNTIGLAVYGIIQYGTLPVIAHAILSIATTIVVSAFVVIKYGFKQVQKHVVVRTYSDHFLLLVALAVPDYSPAIHFVYFTCAWMHFMLNYYLSKDDRLFVTLRVFGVVAVLGAYSLSSTPFVMAIFVFMQLFTVVVSHEIVQKHKTKEKQDEHDRKLKELERRLVTHDLRNLFTAVQYQVSEIDADVRELSRPLNGIRRMGQALEALDGEPAEFKIRSVATQAVMYCKDHLGRKIEYTDEKHETCAKMKIHLLLAALINVITNAHEAGAEKIEVIVGKRSVTVRDNGPGFDVSKLKLGWTTKKNGHGVGLCTSIDALESCCVATEIESKQGAGTSISFVFSEDIVAYPSQS